MSNRRNKPRKAKKPSTAGTSAKAIDATQNQLPPQRLNHAPRSKRSFLILLSTTVGVLAAIATIAASTGYAIEKWRETAAIVDFSGEIDQKKPFAIPLTVKNPSSIFSMYHARMLCTADVEYADDGDNRVLVGADQGAAIASASIDPSSSRNYYCDLPGALEMRANNIPNAPMLTPRKAEMLVAIDYETWVPFPVERRVVTKFVMLHANNGVRWIKGDWIGDHQTVVWPPGTNPPWNNRLKW